MTFTEYQELALRTANMNEQDKALAIYALGLAGETGEVLEHIKKYLGHGKPLNQDEVCKELGDVLWYMAALANQVGLSLDTIAEANIEKLKKRYPDGFAPQDKKD